MNYRADIDGLRGIAVLLVLAFHAFPEWLHGGYIGVDIFFVISGFLICGILLRDADAGRFSIAVFYARRVRRIFPALITVLLATLVAAYFLLLPGELAQAGKHTAGGMGFVANLMFWSEAGYFDSDVHSKILLHLWSLGVEEQFYLVFPLVLYGAWRWSNRFLPMFLALAVISLTVSIMHTQSDASGAYFSPLTRAWELLIGAMVAVWASRGRFPEQLMASSRLRDPLGFSALLLLLATAALYTRNTAFPGIAAALPVLATAVLIAIGGESSRLNRMLAHKRLVAIGLVSYPLYLWHWPLLSIAYTLEAGSPSRRMRLVMLLLAGLLAWLTYRFIEKPIRFQWRSSQAVAILLVTGVLTGLLGWMAYVQNGFPSRYSDKATGMHGLVDYKYDAKGSYGGKRGCFLEQTEGPESFARHCYTPASAGKRPSLMLWGDSHAAHLYPGIDALLGGSVDLLQLTASRCPPIPDMEIDGRPKCKSINDAVVKHLADIRPTMLVLAGAWWKYDDWRALTRTLDFLKSVGVRHVLVVGPVPGWREDLPKLLLRQMRKNPHEPLPMHLKSELAEEASKLDKQLVTLLDGTGAQYASPHGALCGKTGCIVRTGDQAETLTYWDNNHLTREGSVLLLSRFWIDLDAFSPLGLDESKLSAEARLELMRLRVVK